MNSKVKKIIEIAFILTVAWGGQWLWSAIGDPILVPGSTEQTTLGTVSTGEWAATDVAVLHGGTGVSTLTDGGVLLGSGTGAITAMGVLADGEIIVGDGTTDPVAESGATARTSLGLAIGTNVQAWDAVLDDLSALSPVATDQFIVGTGAGTYGHVDLIGVGLTLSGGNFYWSWLGLDDLSETPDNNQIMAWDSPAAGLEWNTLTGTANQIVVTPSAGAITFSTPQDTHTGASPTFVTAKFSGLTDGYVPYHVADATGLANSPIFTDGTNVGVGTDPNKQLELMGANAYTAAIRFSYGSGAPTYYTDWGYKSDGNKIYLTITDNGSAVDVFSALQNGTVELLSGDLLFGNAGTGLPYGSLYLFEAAVNVDISAVGTGVYVKIIGITAGLMNNVSENSDAFNVGKVGVYRVNWQISADSQGNNLTYEVNIFINGVAQSDGSAIQKFGAAADYGSMSGTALLDITNTGHDIDLRIQEVGGAGTDIDIYALNFNIVMIGGT